LWDPSDPLDRILAPDKPEMGHNGPPTAPPSDPGPDKSYRITLPIPEYVSEGSIKAFEAALQEQGDHKHRLDALDQAAYRARAKKSISDPAYRVYEVVRAASKGWLRCCVLDLDKVGYLAGGIDRTRASKVVSELDKGNLAATLKFTEGKLGAPTARKLFIAPVVTAEDRMLASAERLHAEAEAAKVGILQKRAEAARSLYRKRKLKGEESPLVAPEATRNSSCSESNENGFLVAESEFSSCSTSNTLKHNSNSRKKEEGASAPSKLSQNEQVEKGTTTSSSRSVASSSRRPPPSLPLTNGRDHEHNEHDGGGADRARHRHSSPTAPTAEVELAIELYNEGARRHDWTVSHTRPPGLLHRLKARLAEIGGIEMWKLALSAIPLDEFLMGRVRKDDRRPFKLDLQTLLQTDGKLGDVLAKLIDRAAEDEARSAAASGPARYEDLSHNLHRSRAFLKHLALDPAKPWPASAPPSDLFHPQALFEAGFSATKGASTT
jgi:hypothetical protein